jgi:hypothetical protein
MPAAVLVEDLAAVIRTAILNRRSVQAVYDGRQRLLCPHMLGRNKAGKLRVLCLQIGGESSRGLTQRDGPGDWRCLAMEKFSQAELSSAPWRTSSDTLRRPTCIDHIELEVPMDGREDNAAAYT